MDKKTLGELVKKKESNESRVVSVRVRERVLKKLEVKGIDISATMKAVLERLAE